MKKSLLLLLIISIISCKTEKKEQKQEKTPEGERVQVLYAKGFTITDYGNFKTISVSNPFPESEKTYNYLLAKKGAKIPSEIKFDQKITIPVEKIVVTSTTHIPSLETLGEEQSLIGFPSLDYISSKKTRKLISEGKIQELGKNESINTEVLLNLQPDLVVGFAVDGNNKTFNTIEKSGIPVFYNADWTETSPLGKAEWIKFFGALYDKSEAAEHAFNKVAKSYNEAKQLAQEEDKKPDVLSGAMYKDVWYLPNGNSWQAQFIKDANANYLYSNTDGKGSLSLAFEQVLEKAQKADFWIGPAQFTSYEQMLQASEHYKEFEAFQNRKIYTFSSKKGEKGGVLYYEIAPNRPDLVLRDLISIFHKQLLPNHELTIFEELTE